MQELQVTKKDGVAEPWSQDKLIASLGKAGVPTDKAVELATKVQEWAMATAQDGKINSNQIRDKVIEELTVDFPAEADSYKAYKKE